MSLLIKPKTQIKTIKIANGWSLRASLCLSLQIAIHDYMGYDEGWHLLEYAECKRKTLHVNNTLVASKWTK